MTKKTPDLADEDIELRNNSVGLFDIALGVVFISVGLAFVFGLVTYVTPIFLVAFFILSMLRNKIILPRIGYVEHTGMEDKTKKAFLVTLIVGIIMLALAYILYLNVSKGSKSEAMKAFAQDYGPLILGAVISLITALVGKTFSLKRFYIYSPLVFIAFLAIRFVEHAQIIPLTSLVLGVIILIVGSIVLIKFIKTHPVLEDDEDDSESEDGQ